MTLVDVFFFVQHGHCIDRIGEFRHQFHIAQHGLHYNRGTETSTVVGYGFFIRCKALHAINSTGNCYEVGYHLHFHGQVNVKTKFVFFMLYRHDITKVQRIPGYTVRRKMNFTHRLAGFTHFLNQKNNDMCNSILS